MDRLQLAVDDPFRMHVRDFMTEEVEFLRPDMEVWDDPAVLRAFSQYSGLPVVDDFSGSLRVVGMVSHKDVAAAPTTKGMKIKDIMRSPVHSVTANCNIASALAEMLNFKVWRLPVINEKTGALVGIITRSDILEPIASTDGTVRTLGEKLERDEHLNALRRAQAELDDVPESDEFFSNSLDDE